MQDIPLVRVFSAGLYASPVGDRFSQHVSQYQEKAPTKPVAAAKEQHLCQVEYSDLSAAVAALCTGLDGTRLEGRTIPYAEGGVSFC